MEIKRRASAGTLESSDIFVEVLPGQNGVEIELRSTVIHQFGDAIQNVITETLADMRVEHALVRANDRGALDFVIRARLETALLRAGKEPGPPEGEATQ